MSKLYNIHTVWIAMLLLTLSTYSIGKMGFDGTVVVLFLLLTTFIKGTMIIRDFMGLKGVSFLWRAIMYGWLWTICIAIAVTYVISQF